jgi:transcriptional regulator with XRE-family HTH domain
MHRLCGGISQEGLGDALGVTFQQIQSYENGTNRISVGRLHQIAHALGVPVTAFYDGSPEPDVSAPPPEHPLEAAIGNGQALARPETLALLQAFARIEDGQLRRDLVALVAAVAPRPR